LQRILLTSLVGAVLSGCASSVVPDAAPNEPPPNFRAIVLADLTSPEVAPGKRTVNDAPLPPAPKGQIVPGNKRIERVEVSDSPRQLRTDLNGWAWQTCIRASVDGFRKNLSIFVQNSRIIDSRTALITDQCDNAHYVPIEIKQSEPKAEKVSRKSDEG
jgi:hypothetical protein